MVEHAQRCIADGGVFALLIPPIALLIAVIEVVWLGWLVVRALVQRADYIRIRDLVIEGSLGQAILVADARSKDDLLAVCRTAIVTLQSTGSRQQAFDKLVVEAGFRYAGARRAIPRLFVLALLLAIPVGMVVGSRAYAEHVVHEAAASLPESERAPLLTAGTADPAFACPVWLGFQSLAFLAIPALLIGWIETSRSSNRVRDQVVKSADELAEMASRVIDPSHRVYREERERERRVAM